MSLASIEAQKAAANKLFSMKRYAAAAEAYTEAIISLPATDTELGKLAGATELLSVLYSNRAMAYKRLESVNWDAVESDASAAGRCDHRNPKAHYLKGLCVARRGEYREAVTLLERALEMAKRQKRPANQVSGFEAAVWQYRREWQARSSAEESAADAALHSKLLAALAAQKQAQLIALENTKPVAPSAAAAAPALSSPPAASTGGGGGAGAGATAAPTRPGTAVAMRSARRYSSMPLVHGDPEAEAAPPGDAPGVTGGGAGTTTPQSAANSSGGSGGGEAAAAAAAATAGVTTADAITATHADTEAELAELFAQREACRVSREVPEHFTCSITLCVMTDPVTTVSGHSYEREAIEAHLKRKPEEPHTRQTCHVADLRPNLALRAAIQAFLAEHPWAHPSQPDADF